VLLRSGDVSVFYNRIAGQNLDRLAALSDGIFAVAMTLLVLNLHIPAAELIHSDRQLWHALRALGPEILVYLMSFLTLGIFWVGQQTQLNYLDRCHRTLAWIHILFLFSVTLMPFSTLLLADFLSYRVALLVYWANILLSGVTLFLSWSCAVQLGLAKPDTPPEITAAIQRRIIVAQLWYAFAVLLCIISPYWSIALIVVIQLNYVIAPNVRLPFRRARSNAA
jgi:TMEM175 potassium channel family protein